MVGDSEVRCFVVLKPRGKRDYVVVSSWSTVVKVGAELDGLDARKRG